MEATTDAPNPEPAPSGRSGLSDRFLARIVGASFDPYVVLDAEGTVLFVSDSIHDIIGLHSHQAVGRNMLDVLAPDGSEPAITAFEAFTAPGREEAGWAGPALTIRLRHTDGHLVSCRVLAVPSGDPEFKGLVLRIRLTESNEKLDAAIASMVSSDPLPVTLSHLLAFANEQMPYSIGAFGLGHDGRRFATVVAHPLAPFQVDGQATLPSDPNLPWNRAVGTDWPRFVAVASLPEPFRSELNQAGVVWCWVVPLDHHERDSDVMVFFRLAPGSPGPHLMEAVERIARMARVAIDAHHSRQVLERQANTDELTGLANRAALVEHLTLLRDTGSGPVGVLYCDLDDFKPINDTYGHGVGDHVLQAAGHRIASSVRADDLASRIGGDEFVVVCAGTSSAELDRLADRLLEAFATPITARGHEVKIGISVGMALVDQTSTIDPDRLLDRADRALLQAKAAGKGRTAADAH